jgi:2-C-methyl-D-erythritol 2,4-cyclodiphosphate synthase
VDELNGSNNMIRAGIGFDIHRFTQGRKLIMAGVEIPFEKGLDGHSDADVASHAIMDALLGATGDNDIGTHFPNTDEKWKNASSLKMMTYIVARLQMKKVRINNIDVTILAEAPKIMPYRKK